MSSENSFFPTYSIEAIDESQYRDLHLEFTENVSNVYFGAANNNRKIKMSTFSLLGNDRFNKADLLAELALYPNHNAISVAYSSASFSNAFFNGLEKLSLSTTIYLQ